MNELPMQEAVLKMRLHLAVNALKLINDGRYWSGKPMTSLEEARQLANQTLYGIGGLLEGTGLSGAIVCGESGNDDSQDGR